jgi:Leucine-rich repeat (LRR) protein
VTRSIHAPLLEQSIPDWLNQATAQHHEGLRSTRAPLPPWYRKASRQQRKAFDASLAASFNAQSRFARTMADLHDIHAFAEPLLARKLRELFSVELDLDNTFLLLVQAIEAGIWGIEVGTFEVSRMSLLQAALHNFEAAEGEHGAFHRSSAFYRRNGPSGWQEAISPSMSVRQFIQACRALDIGAQYQQYLKRFLYPQSSVELQNLREQFIAVQKTALRAAAERALLQNDIEPQDHASILAIIDGQLQPCQGEKRIWFCELGLMKRRLNGCLCLAIGARFEAPTELLLYIPDDPYHPLKRYRAEHLESALRQRFTQHQASSAEDSGAAAYQRFFSRFVPYADRAYYFSQFTCDAADATFVSKYWSYLRLLNDWLNGFSPLPSVALNHLPPAPAIRQVPSADPFLAPVCMPFKGRFFWDDNIDPWDYLFERHREQMIDDARSYAVPSAEIDARVRKALFAKLLGIGMLALNTLSMFVPVLGETMMAVMACQLLEESIEGVVEWSEGDRKAATAHLADIAQNLLLLGLMVGVGKGFDRLLAVDATPVIEDLHPVTLPDGSRRLCRAELDGYEVPGPFNPQTGPDAQGRYEWDGKTVIRIDGRVYEPFYDPAQACWRIRHPVDPQAYQPMLTHNRAGAWRHTLENPLGWSRTHLLRRLGHVADAYSDSQLLQIADISGVSDNALRRVHMDNRLPPPELVDALRLFDADRSVAQVLEQIVGERAIDERYLLALHLVSELPGWPAGRIVQVFEHPRLTGPRIEYGFDRLTADTPRKPPIRMSRFDVLSGELPMRVLAALEESEVIALLGPELARDRGWRPQALRDRIAAYAQTRRPALFDSLYRRNATADPGVAKLQRVFPGLSDAAAQEILAHAEAPDLATLQTSGRVPHAMLEEARWYARRGRLTRTLAQLQMDNMLSADTRRLALHTLSRLPGWSDDVRLEVRVGHIAGRLLDAIGSETAGLRGYVVKTGPVYQAFNARGEALNAPSASADTFYASVLHALPAATRRALGVAQAGQSLALQRAIRVYATEHVADSAAILAPHGPGRRAFVPPQRIREHLLGYPASGEGAAGAAGLNTALVVRIQQLYPGLKFTGANGFLLNLLRAGKTEPQILQVLEELRQQWLSLRNTLDTWAEWGSNLRQKSLVVLNLKVAWRNGPLAEEKPALRRLELISDEPLPALSVDFPHISLLRLRLPNSSEAQIRDLLVRFPELKYLDLRDSRLIVDPIPAENAAGLVELDLSGNPLYWLDVASMSNLRTLILKDTRMQSLPHGAEHLPHLSWLDLRNTLIRELPPGFLARDDMLLNCNLAGTTLTPQTWLEQQIANYRYEVAHGLPHGALERFHLEQAPEIDTQPIENGTLLASRLLPFPPELPASENMPSFIERLQRIDAELNEDEARQVIQRLRDGASDEQVNARLNHWGERFAALTRQLNGWVFSRRSGSPLYGGRWSSSQGRSEAAARIIACWKKGLAGEAVGDARVLDLEAIHGLGALPALPPEFTHVEALNLRGNAFNEADLQGFLPAFPRLRWLELGLNDLSSVPQAIADMPVLEELGLSANRFADMPSLVRQLSHLAHLRWLKLNYNRFKVFDGPVLQALPGLQRLELSYNQLNRFVGPVSHALQRLLLTGNSLAEWPDGVLQAPNLEYLGLTGNPIAEIPLEAFDGSHDRLLAGTRMSSDQRHLSADNLLRIRAYLDRVGGTRALGISRQKLEKWIAADQRQVSDDTDLDTSTDDSQK